MPRSPDVSALVRYYGDDFSAAAMEWIPWHIYLSCHGFSRNKVICRYYHLSVFACCSWLIRQQSRCAMSPASADFSMHFCQHALRKMLYNTLVRMLLLGETCNYRLQGPRL